MHQIWELPHHTKITGETASQIDTLTTFVGVLTDNSTDKKNRGKPSIHYQVWIFTPKISINVWVTYDESTWYMSFISRLCFAASFRGIFSFALTPSISSSFWFLQMEIVRAFACKGKMHFGKKWNNQLWQKCSFCQTFWGSYLASKKPFGLDVPS